MQLNEREASLVDAFRRLPPEAATELSALVERLAELAPNHRIDWSDSWSDEDLNDFRSASLRRFDAEGPRIAIETWRCSGRNSGRRQGNEGPARRGHREPHLSRRASGCGGRDSHDEVAEHTRHD